MLEATRVVTSTFELAIKGVVLLSRLAVRLPALCAALALAAGVAGCDRSGSAASPVPSGASSGREAKFEVVAAENFWGSIAAQLAGDRASVTSIIVNPNTDPHSYEPTAQDARTLAGSTMAIVNGIGYDNWAPKLLGASPRDGRVLLNVGALLSLKEGDNAHRWYFPSSVHRVVGQIVADYEKLDPADGAYFAQRKRIFETRDLARYDQLRRKIRASYAGVPVGYSESIFQGLGEDLGLKLLTPYSFAKAVAEGTDITAEDKRKVDTQARDHEIKVWIFNSQNVTPDVQRVNQIVSEAHIPIATVTETLAPASDSFERWQVSQLERLMRALAQATGR
jgi:zinc/manganese transport system substrate-binding protein